ncbi:MAG: kelch repeat-containing protein [Candidatus Acidiferrales bacterium]
MSSHAGNFTIGQQGATYTLTISNSGNAPTNGTTVTVTDTVPAGMTLVGMAGNGWTCAGNSCTRTDVLAAGSSYPTITVTVNVALNATSPVSNTAGVSGGGSASATTTGGGDSTTILIPSLSITSAHAGSFKVGQQGTYTLTVTNAAAGTTATIGMVTATDTLPAGMTLGTMTGGGWTCVANSCTRSDALAPGASYPAITVTVTVTEITPTTPLNNSASVSGGASPSANSAPDSTTILFPSMSVTSTHVGNFVQGQQGTYTLTVSNAAGANVAATVGTVSATDTLPAGMSMVSMTGTGWTCATLPNCTRSDVLAAGASYPTITATVNVAANASSPETNQVSASDGALSSGNGNDPTTIVSTPTLSIVKTHVGNFTQGQVNAQYLVTVTNAAGAASTSGLVTVADTLPAGETLVSMTGTNWTCVVTTCTRSDALAGGASYDQITVLVNVAINATTPQVNMVGVSGGGSASANTSDSTTISGTGSFVLTGSMNNARDPFTATLLNNGMVLVAGGEGTGGALASAELYNPATGIFTLTGSLNTARALHTATLLNNGMVLIVGGEGAGPYLASAELYNPANGTFTVTGSLSIGRALHAATLLNDGTVLITGGQDTAAYLSSAELYNPTSGTFTTMPPGNMTTPREIHTTTVLDDGTVLIAGGLNATGALASAEIYSPVSQTFSTAPPASMANARYNHTATLLNNGMVLITGGQTSSSVLTSVELYNPASGAFTTPAGVSLSTARYEHTATLLSNGMVLVAGGQNSTPSIIPLASAELYDPTAGRFSATGSMNAARYNHIATLLNNGTVLVAGGLNTATGHVAALASAEIYGPATSALPNLVSISVSPASPLVPLDTAQRFIATGTFSSGGPQQLASVTWSSSNTAAVSVTNDASNSGAAYALGAVTSSATISACDGPAGSPGSVCGSTLATVGPPALVSIAVTPSPGIVAAGLTLQFHATGTYTDGTTPDITSLVTWNSSLTGFATISNAAGTQGLATGVAPGATMITATLGAVGSASVTLTVTPAVLETIAVTPTNPTISTVAPGNTVQFTATGTFSDGSKQNLTTTATWGSSNTGVATISNAAGSQGLATAGGTPGPTTITATLSGIIGMTTLTAAVPAPDLSITKSVVGAFTAGSNGTFQIAVSNIGTGPTTGTITVTDTLNAAFTFVSGTGTGWTCTASSQVVTCTNPGPIASGASTANITLTVMISGTASGIIANTAMVSDPGDTTDVADKSSTANASIVSANACAGMPSGGESLFKGQYAMVMQGWQGGGNGTPVTMALSVDADGTGKIASLTGGIGGDLDLNTVSGGPQHYTITPSGIGVASKYVIGPDPSVPPAGFLGCMTVATINPVTSSPGPTITYTFSLGKIVSGAFTKGRVIEFDDQAGTGTRVTGVLMPQDATAFSSGNTSALHANYTFGQDGEDSSGHFAIAGAVVLNPGTGIFTSVILDVDDAGFAANLSGSGSIPFSSVSAVDGRATLSVTPTGQPTDTNAVYIVNANQFFTVGTDAYSGGFPIRSGLAIVSASSYTSLPPAMIVHLTGESICSGSTPCASANLGLINPSAGTTTSGTTTGTFTGDIYSYDVVNGAQTTNFPSGNPGTYSLADSTGRVMISNAGKSPPVFYLANPQSNTEPIVAFFVGTDSSGSFGFGEAGATAAITTSSLAAEYFGGTEDMGDNTVKTSIAVLIVASSGAISGTSDQSNQSGLQALKAISGGPITITNLDPSSNAAFGTGNVGASTVAITNGTRLFFIDESGGPAVIMIIELSN